MARYYWQKDPRWTVTCNGEPWKISDDYQECVEFVAMQKRKLRGAGLAQHPVTDAKLAAKAALCSYTIRPYQIGDTVR